ncbi:MAG: hypothetical protein FWH36_02910 [Lentimicrobiaceae bacterium]|nr:hypothetical protein [Lentimicrobiaceae bacterium]
MKKWKLVLIFVLIFFLHSCNTHNHQKNDTVNNAISGIVNDTIIVDSTNLISKCRNTVKDIMEVYDDSAGHNIWHGGGVIWLVFEKGKVTFDYNFSCGFWYKTQIIDNKKIVFIWDYNLDCKYDSGIRKGFGLSRKPIKGKLFGEFVLVNDTLLKVNYYYPEWVKQFNKYHDDEVFPTLFVLDPHIF